MGYETELNLVKQSLAKPRGIKKPNKVNQRIGRAKQKYPSVHQLYDIRLDVDSELQIVREMHWQKNIAKAEEVQSRLGTYFLRTNLKPTHEGL